MLRKLRFIWHIGSESGTHTLDRVGREVKLWAKLVEQSTTNVGPNLFLCQEEVKKVMGSLSKGKFSLKCTPREPLHKITFPSFLYSHFIEGMSFKKETDFSPLPIHPHIHK